MLYDDFMNKDMKEEAKRLFEGNERFRASGGQNYRELVRAQHPESVVVACSDSRVAPEIIFNAKLGELFVVRTAGEVVDAAALASIEYAVEHLGTKHIAIVAHTRCGAVTAAQQYLLTMMREGAEKTKESAKEENSLDKMIKDIARNISNKKDLSDLNAAIIDNAIAQRNAMMKSEIISKKLKEGLVISLLLYDIETAQVSSIDK